MRVLVVDNVLRFQNNVFPLRLAHDLCLLYHCMIESLSSILTPHFLGNSWLEQSISGTAVYRHISLPSRMGKNNNETPGEYQTRVISCIVFFPFCFRGPLVMMHSSSNLAIIPCFVCIMLEAWAGTKTEVFPLPPTNTEMNRPLSDHSVPFPKGNLCTSGQLSILSVLGNCKARDVLMWLLR